MFTSGDLTLYYFITFVTTEILLLIDAYKDRHIFPFEINVAIAFWLGVIPIINILFSLYILYSWGIDVYYWFKYRKNDRLY